MSFLKGHIIVDFATRLPCPLASKILLESGAEVIKIEDERFRDPFQDDLIPNDKSFHHWYNSINEGKRIIRLDFSSSDIKSAIHKYLKKASGILISTPHKIREKIGIDESSLRKHDLDIAVLEVLSNEHGHPTHDLNIISKLDVINLHLKTFQSQAETRPPLLPFAAISFAQTIALNMTGLVLNEATGLRYKKLKMDEEVENIFNLFTKSQHENRDFLHNGKYPCYNLYRLRDHKVLAVAAVEEKYWNQFCEIFNLSHVERFDTNPSGTHLKLTEYFKNISSDEVKSKLNGIEICVNLC